MPQQATYVQGQRVTVDGVFRLLGVPTDPTVVTAEVRTPSGAHLSLVYPSGDLARTDLGAYEVTVTALEAGTYSIRLSGAGVVDAVGEAFVNVEPSRVI
jgi:hypothetical protein